MTYPNKYGLVLCLSALWFFVRANTNTLDTLPALARTEIGDVGRFFPDPKNTYGDFDQQKKDDEYIAYPLSSTQFFLGTNLWQDLYVNLNAAELPALVNDYSIELLPRHNWPDLIIGFHWSSYKYFLQFQYYNRALKERISARTQADSPYSVERELIFKGYTLVMARDIKMFRFTKRIQLVGAAGVEISRADVSLSGLSSFQFENRENLDAILGNTVAVDLDENQVRVNMEQQLFLFSTATNSLFWQIGFDIQINDQLNLYLKANNVIPVNLFLKTTRAYLETPDEAWEENFVLQYNSFELKNSSIQLSLSYRINETNRTKRKLKLN